MLSKLCCIGTLLLASAVLAGPLAAQRRFSRTTLGYEQRCTNFARQRAELKESKGAWPAGYKERALEAINEAVESLRVNLAIREVDTVKGVERNPDFYAKFKDHPRLRAAILDLRQARLELESNLANLREPKDRELRERASTTSTSPWAHLGAGSRAEEVKSVTVPIEQCLDDPPAIELDRAVEAVADLGVGVDAQDGVDRRADVVGGVGRRGGVRGVLVALADHLSRLDTAPAKGRRSTAPSARGRQSC